MHCDPAASRLIWGNNVPFYDANGARAPRTFNVYYKCHLPENDAGELLDAPVDPHFCFLAFLARRLATEQNMAEAYQVKSLITNYCPLCDYYHKSLEDVLPKIENTQ